MYTLFPNAMHIIQPLDLVLMGSIKKSYREEMRKWLLANIGEAYDKYQFIDVFHSTYDTSATMSNAVRGFEIAGIYPWDPSKAQSKKLAPASLYS